VGSRSTAVITSPSRTKNNNEVYETGNNALRMNGGNTDSFIIRGNHLHHAGLLTSSVGTTEGEGMYVGCNDAACVAISVHLRLRRERRRPQHRRRQRWSGRRRLAGRPGLQADDRIAPAHAVPATSLRLQ
jgi:hypothetical protein